MKNVSVVDDSIVGESSSSSTAYDLRHHVAIRVTDFQNRENSGRLIKMR